VLDGSRIALIVLHVMDNARRVVLILDLSSIVIVTDMYFHGSRHDAPASLAFVATA